MCLHCLLEIITGAKGVNCLTATVSVTEPVPNCANVPLDLPSDHLQIILPQMSEFLASM